MSYLCPTNTITERLVARQNNWHLSLTRNTTLMWVLCSCCPHMSFSCDGLIVNKEYCCSELSTYLSLAREPKNYTSSSVWQCSVQQGQEPKSQSQASWRLPCWNANGGSFAEIYAVMLMLNTTVNVTALAGWKAWISKINEIVPNIGDNLNQLQWAYLPSPVQLVSLCLVGVGAGQLAGTLLETTTPVPILRYWHHYN